MFLCRCASYDQLRDATVRVCVCACVCADLNTYAALSLGIQWFVYLVHGLPQLSEKFYDASGSLTHFALVLAAVLSKSDRTRRQILLSVCAVVWLTRLGSFLFTRIMKDGRDGRFDALKRNPLRFLSAWTIQALWVFMIELPVLVVGDQAADAGGELVVSECVEERVFMMGKRKEGCLTRLLFPLRVA